MGYKVKVDTIVCDCGLITPLGLKEFGPGDLWICSGCGNEFSICRYRSDKPIERTMTNEEYEAERNKLIPQAEKHADKMAGVAPSEIVERQKWSAKWDRFFHKRMNELAREAGLTK